MRRAKGTLAIDFDGTIVTHAYPYIGDLKDGAKEAINSLYKEWRIIIWTCRNNYELNSNVQEHLERVEAFLEGNGIDFDRVDAGRQGKVLADFYIDDRAIEFKDNWAHITSKLRSI